VLGLFPLRSFLRARSVVRFSGIGTPAGYGRR
jgi:hypothetical protein